MCAAVLFAGLCATALAAPAQLDTVSDALNLKYGVAGPLGQGVDHKYFYVDHNDHFRIPNWVGYHLSRKDLRGTAVRKDDYHEDEWLEPDSVRAQPDFYTGSGYDRGHLAPAEDFTRSKKAMSTSFLMSNMSPQYHATNGGVWSRLEAAVREMVKDEGEAWIVSGDAFLTKAGKPGKPAKWITSGGRKLVAVPTHLFKALLTFDKETGWAAYAFLIPNAETSLGKPPRHYLVAVDTLEARTGWDFFPLLDDTLQKRIEGRKPAVWPW
jgi:endonuclease G